MGDLAAALASPDSAAVLLSVTVVTLSSDGTMSVDLGGGRVVSPVVRLDSTPTLAPGDAVIVMRDGVGGWVCLGRRLTTAQTTTPASARWALPWNVLAATTSTGTGTVSRDATQAGSWRDDTGSWYTTQPSQGYNSYASRIYWGAWFYGAGAFTANPGARCTSASLKLVRTTGGVFAAVNAHLRLHLNASRPSGPVSWTGGTLSVPGPAVGASSTVTLPASWGQALLDGTAKGIGLYYTGSSDYAHYSALAVDSTSGHLSVGWAA